MIQAEWVSGNIFIRPNALAKQGDTIDGHTHHFDHTTIVFRGAVRVRATLPDGTTRTGEFSAPAHFLVRAEVTHEIEALEDDTVLWCVYAHRDPQGRVTQQFTGWQEAYT